MKASRNRPSRLWLALGVAALLSPPAVVWAAGVWDGSAAALRGIVPCGVVQTAVLLFLRRRLSARDPARSASPAEEAPGPADAVTLFRAGLSAALAGFILQPTSGAPSWVPWLPGAVYLSAALLDLADGWVARRTGGGTRLGAPLDGFCDALGLLVATAAAVAFGRAPLVYLIGVGGGVFFLQAAVRLRRWSGRRVAPVGRRPAARLAAGWQMLFAGLLLLPLYEPRRLEAAAWVMTGIMVLSLGKDWLIVCGRAEPSGKPAGARLAALEARTAAIAPLVLRGGIVAGWLAHAGPAAAAAPALALAISAAALACALGVAARAAAVLLSLLVAHPATTGQSGSAAVLAAFAAALVYTGAGKPRLFQPEDRLVLAPRSTSGGGVGSRKEGP